MVDVGGFMYGGLLLTGSLATAMAGGLAVVHWAAAVRPYLDADGWLIATYGLVALAVCSIIDGGDPSGYTVTLVVLAAGSAFVAGLRRCGSVVVLFSVNDDDDSDGAGG